MLPSYVKRYVKRNKTDAADADAICVAVTRPAMRFVPVKNETASAALVLHRARDFLVGQATQARNAIRAHMAEFGIVTAKGSKRVASLVKELDKVPEAARLPLRALFDQLSETQAGIDRQADEFVEVHRQNEMSRRLALIPGVGVLTATAIAATTPKVSNFDSTRDYAAWLGLTPKRHSTGGKPRSGGISKMGPGASGACCILAPWHQSWSGAGAATRGRTAFALLRDDTSEKPRLAAMPGRERDDGMARQTNPADRHRIHGRSRPVAKPLPSRSQPQTGAGRG